jgi:hypothetical protein
MNINLERGRGPFLVAWYRPGLPDFSLENIPKSEKMYQIIMKNTNGHKMHQIFPFQGLPNGHFWCANIASGNPGAYLLVAENSSKIFVSTNRYKR